MNKERFTVLFSALCDLLKKDYREEICNAYYDVLKESPNLECAMKSCARECVFFPVPAEIIARTKPDMGLAWTNVLRVARAGGDGWDSLNDLEATTLGEIGGLQIIQMADDEALQFIFNNFKKSFDSICLREIAIPDKARFATIGIHPESIPYLKIKPDPVKSKEIEVHPKVKELIGKMIK